MKTPVMSFRVPSDQREEMRNLVNLVKGNPPAMKAALAAAKGAPEQAPQGANRGPFVTKAAALDFLIGQLVHGLRPLAIFLFGSRARGDFRPDSDFDLLVVTSQHLNRYEVFAPVAACPVAVDVIPYQVDDFLRECSDKDSMVHLVYQEGRLLYAQIGSPFYAQFRAEKAAAAA